MKNSISHVPRPAVSYFQTKRDSINRGLENRLYRRKVGVLQTEFLHRQQYTITSSTVTSHNSQLIKIFHVARNLSSCELLPCSDCGVYGVMLDCLSWGYIAYFPWCRRGCSVSCDRRRPSLWFSRGLGSRTPCCLAVSFLIPILARQTLPLCLGFAL